MSFSDNLARLILALKENPNLDLDEVLELIIETPESEILRASEQFITLCHRLTEALVKSKRSVSGIRPMSRAIITLQTHRSQLTALHANLCLLCLDSKCLNPALPFLDTVYTDIYKTDQDAKHVVLFYYYGGLIYAAFKNFERASYYFEIVLTMPANTISPIMQETYQKLIVINLLLHGKLPENILPRYAPSCVLRQRKQMGSIYLKLAVDYATLNYDKISRTVDLSTPTYEADENMGLIKQCLTRVHRRNIQRLTKTFLTLSLRDVANHVGLSSEKEAERYILNMIDDGEIFATINQRDGMVVFQDSCENFDSVEVFQKIQEDMGVTMKLISILKKMDGEGSPKDSKNISKANNDA